MKKVELKNVGKRYGSINVIENISFEIKEGEICGLLGINGAGKSTIMKCILGIVKQSDGEIFFNEKKISESDLSEMGALVETPAIYDNLTAFENLKAKALLYNIPDSTILQKLELVNLANNKKKSKKFSLGMKVRLGIAMAILTDPEFLILDEPTNGLDPQGIEDLKSLIKKLSQDGTTILLSSHRFKDISDVTDRVVIINKGKIAYNDKIKDENYLSELFFKIVNGEV